MLNKTLISFLFASSLLACKDPAPQIITLPPAAEVVKPGQMTVTGSAQLEVSPDCADLTMTIQADGAKPGAATTRAQAKQQELISALLKLGVNASELKLSQLSLTPIYEQHRDFVSELKIATYRASITITVTTKQFEQIAPIMEAGTNAGASSVYSQFRRSDLSELKAKVREMALAAAKDKAERTAKVLGIDVGRVVSVVEAPNGYMWANTYFPANRSEVQDQSSPTVVLGGALQPLSLEVTIGYELNSKV